MLPITLRTFTTENGAAGEIQTHEAFASIYKTDPIGHYGTAALIYLTILTPDNGTGKLVS